jgi:hypothetical protein
MEVSSKKETNEDLTGSQLLEAVVSLTELPHSMMHDELGQIIKVSGHEPETLTIEQLRESMIAYLNELHAAYLAESSDFPSDQLFASDNKLPLK